jgi:hypothetical protein
MHVISFEEEYLYNIYCDGSLKCFGLSVADLVVKPSQD